MQSGVKNRKLIFGNSEQTVSRGGRLYANLRYHSLTPYVREEMLMLARVPQRTVLNQDWTFYTFLYVEAYFRIEQWLLTDVSATGNNHWTNEFNAMFHGTFAPLNISLDELRLKYVAELLRHMDCTAAASGASELHTIFIILYFVS